MFGILDGCVCLFIRGCAYTTLNCVKNRNFDMFGMVRTSEDLASMKLTYNN